MATYRSVGKETQAIIRRKGFPQRSAMFPSKGAAKAWAVPIELAMKAARRGQAERHRVGDLFDSYIDKVIDNAEQPRKGGRWEKIRLDALRSSFEFTGFWLDDVMPEHCAAWVAKRSREVKPGTVLREIGLVSTVWQYGKLELRWLTTNPWRDVRKPKQPRPRKRRPTEEEIEAILTAANYVRGARPLNKTQATALTFLFEIETAMRSGELCGIEPKHFDEQRRVVMLGDTKNGDDREVPLSKAAFEIVELMLPLGYEKIFGLKPAYRDALFRKIRAKAAKTLPGIATLHFHDGRREASTRIGAKFAAQDAAKITGHRDLKTFQNVYYGPDMADMVKKMG